VSLSIDYHVLLTYGSLDRGPLKIVEKYGIDAMCASVIIANCLDSYFKDKRRTRAGPDGMVFDRRDDLVRLWNPYITNV
jgi:hypothetical protein